MPNNNQLSLRIYCDGGARGNPGPAASAFVVIDEQGAVVYHQGFYLGVATNNQAEYKAVFFALSWLSQNYPHSQLSFYLDSQLVVNQLRGMYKTKDSILKIENFKIVKLIENCKLKIENFIYIPRSQNAQADSLVNQTLDQYI